MNVRDLLAIPILSDAKVVAGASGLARNVQSVNMMDAPDIIDFLKPNELLVTTGYGLKDRPGALVDLVRQMAQKGCAGLGIKIRRFLPETPPEMARAADEWALPIIELPYQPSLGEIVNQTINFILEKRAEELRYALDIHRSFTTLVFRGRGVGAVVENLGALLGCPVQLLDPGFRVIAASSGHGKLDPRCRDALLTHLRSLNGSIPDMTAFSLLESTNPPMTFTLFPVRTHRQQNGFLVVYGCPFESGVYPRLAVEQAVNVMAFDLLKRQAVEENTRRMKNEFFTDFLSGDIGSRREIINLGKLYGLRENQPYVCAVCRIDDRLEEQVGGLEERRRRLRDAVYDRLETALEEVTSGGVLFTRGESFVLLRPAKEYGVREEHEMAAWLRSVQEEIARWVGVSVSFGLSPCIRHFYELPRAYREGESALHMGYRSGRRRFIQPYRAKELADLFRWIPREDLIQFYENSLNDLAHPADKEKLDLLHTLSVYLDNNCQIAETAKQLYVHRNTVVYRLDKCKELIGRDLKEPDVTLRLRVALLIRGLMYGKEAEGVPGNHG
ncbi:PucR family transcriptional regulator [Kyrpidia tusciae]|uniref:Transcriptional regulator, PucR family n=1 Tax=Kyrpidia tusciae (strain DSM 2912 / NBRC 15312 / T2) TaxID=562970 RepID=D5WQV2_KYRT2|nr:PucR family transcriptional regulator [Kyrpidia tusciae]ADG06711.1 transcriptional regulator, PucR family [Kyrpidia tusciae DSM 2912]